MRTWMSFWPLLLLFYVSVLFHPQYCFYVGGGEGGLHFSMGNMWRKRLLKDCFLPPLDSCCLQGKNFRLPLTPRMSHEGLMFYVQGSFMTRSAIYQSSSKCNREAHAPGKTTILFISQMQAIVNGVITEKVVFIWHWYRLV